MGISIHVSQEIFSWSQEIWEIQKMFTFQEIWLAAGENFGDFLRKYCRFHYLRKIQEIFGSGNFGHDRKKNYNLTSATVCMESVSFGVLDAWDVPHGTGRVVTQ